MQDILKIPVIGGVIQAIGILIQSFLLIIKKPSLILFYIYAALLSTIWITLITWTLKLVFLILCWASKWEYVPLSEAILCEKEPTLNLIGGLENIRHFEQFSNLASHVQELLSAPSFTELFTDIIVLVLLVVTYCGYLLAILYYTNYSMTAMAHYINTIKKGLSMAPFSALSLDHKTKMRVWQWAIVSALLFFAIRSAASALFASLPLYYMCKAYKFGYTPFTSSLLTLISFYAPALLAYEELSLRGLLKHLFTTILKAPSATLTVTATLSIALYFLPSCILRNSHLSMENLNPTVLTIWGLYLIAYFITPVSQILLYRSITNRTD